MIYYGEGYIKSQSCALKHNIAEEKSNKTWAFNTKSTFNVILQALPKHLRLLMSESQIQMFFKQLNPKSFRI